MAGINSLLDISRRSLNAQTESLRVISNNIANVNTEGYTRRRAELVTQGSSDPTTSAFGNGVEIDKVIRLVDQFINTELTNRTSERSRAEIRDELLSRAETPFAVDSTIRHIGYELSVFFSTMEDLSENPSNIPLRQAVIEQGNALTQSIQASYDIVADLQREADTRIGLAIDDINRITGQVAEINNLVLASEVGDQEDLTLRDQRDQLLRDLSEKVSFRSVEDSDGAIQVYLENGFTLVNGSTSRDLALENAPSFAGAAYPGLDSSPIGYVVYDFDTTGASPSHMDLTSVLAAGGGEIGGLLSLRGVQPAAGTSPFDAQGDLVELGSRVEAIARDLLTRFNSEYLGVSEFDEDPATPGVHDPSSVDLNGNTPASVFSLFTFTGAADADGDGLPEQSDLTAAAQTSFANIIEFGVSDPNEIAAALDLDQATSGSTPFAPGDATIINDLLALRTQSIDYSTYNVNYNRTNTIEGVYEESVTFSGSLQRSNANDLFVLRDREAQTKELHASEAGVSLDEEFAKLINFQRAFEASSRMIRLGDELLQEIIGILG